ncbi:MAG TPA: DUF4390 domain-containing protein [Longimicrobiales bacterium]
MVLLVWALLFAGAPLPGGAALQAALAVAPDPATGHRPVLRIGAILADPALEEAARSGLPLRLKSRVELWRDGFFDSLEGSDATTWVLLYEPLEERFVVRSRSSPSEARYFTSFDAARAAIEGAHPLPLRPPRDGRYYYTAVLELETLSLSDLEELERWLKGELQPAVSGEGSVPGAVGRGVKRLFIRVLGLPARRYEARSDWFVVERVTE